MHPLEGGELDVLETTPGPASPDHLGLVKADDGFSQSVAPYGRIGPECLNLTVPTDRLSEVVLQTQAETEQCHVVCRYGS